MDLRNGSWIKCGEVMSFTPKLNEQTTFEQIQQCLRDLFPVDLPADYRIVYYDPTRLSLVDLEEQLQRGFNPFQARLSMNAQNTDDTSTNMHLFIVKASALEFNVHSIASMPIMHTTDDSSSSLETTSQLPQRWTMKFSRELRPCIPTELCNSSIATDYDAVEDSSEHLSGTIQTMGSQSNIENLPSHRLCFSLDVKSNQKDIYRSDEFSVDPTKSNGRIARIQGIKEEYQKMSQVLPRLRIPHIYRQSKVTLLVFVAHEELVNGTRRWYKHSHKGFLPENYTKDTETVNPLELDVNQCTFTHEGDMRLSLAMITKWNKSSSDSEEFYRLAENETLRVHSAAHDSCSPRLFCVLRQNGKIIWDTFCLSDFIRSQRPPKQAYSKVTTGRITSPKSKRSKTDA